MDRRQAHGLDAARSGRLASARELARGVPLAEDRVRVIVPDMGSAYGGKHTGEQAIEAARLAQRGRAVRSSSSMTRDEEFSWGYFRPAGVIDIKAGVDAAGRITAWEFDNWNSGASGLPHAVRHRRTSAIAFHPSDSPLRQGSYRGLAATANHYAREMHMDAIARELAVDAVDVPADASGGRAHARGVDGRGAARRAGRAPRSAGRALGIACGTEKGSYVATAAEVAPAPGGFA